MAEMTKALAQQYSDDEAFLDAFLQSNVGKRFTKLIDKIDQQATDSAMRGKTPLSHDAYMEGRGKMLVTKSLRDEVTTIRQDATNGRTWLQSQTIEENSK